MTAFETIWIRAKKNAQANAQSNGVRASIGMLKPSDFIKITPIITTTTPIQRRTVTFSLRNSHPRIIAITISVRAMTMKSVAELVSSDRLRA